MVLSSIGKTSSSWPFIAPILAGTSFDFSHLSRGEYIGIGSFLLAGIVAAAVAKYLSRRGGPASERRSGPEKFSNSLVALSSAAVLAVYTAGYYRTRSAEDQYVRQATLRRAPIGYDVGVAAPSAPPSTYSAPTASSGPSSQSVTGLPHRRNHARSAPPPLPNVAIVAPTPSESSAAPTPSSAGLPVGISTDDPAVLAGNPLQGETSAPAIPASQPRYKDGTYLGWGSSRHGDIQASVVVQGGRIVSAAIAQCWTRYPCTWITPLPGQVVSRQNANVDNVSGATESTDAFFGAITDALSKAK